MRRFTAAPTICLLQRARGIRPSLVSWCMGRFADGRSRDVFLVALCACLLAGCSAGARSATPDPRVIDFLSESAPTNLDPRFGTDAQSEDIDGLLFDSLVARD